MHRLFVLAVVRPLSFFFRFCLAPFVFASTNYSYLPLSGPFSFFFRFFASLSADHRATDGLTGARFLNALGRLLQEPQVL